MTVSVQFPRTQHWTTGRDGFRITVMVYKTGTGPCVTCGARQPAMHSVWADGRGLHNGFSAGPVWVCDTHRPPKGILPPLEYRRLAQGLNLLSRQPSGAVIYEYLAPYPAQACRECGDPAQFQVREQCQGCDDPARHASTQLTQIRREGITTHPPERHHTLHDSAEWWACAAHAPSAGKAA